MKFKVDFKLPEVVSDKFYIDNLDYQKLYDIVKLYLKEVKNNINISMPYSNLGLTIPCIVEDTTIENDTIYFTINSTRNLNDCKVILFGELELDKKEDTHKDETGKIPLVINGISYIGLFDVTDIDSIADDKLSKVESL